MSDTDPAAPRSIGPEPIVKGALPAVRRRIGGRTDRSDLDKNSERNERWKRRWPSVILSQDHVSTGAIGASGIFQAA